MITDRIIPYFFVGDEAFALDQNMMKPYSQRAMNVDFHKKFFFNGRLSRARRVVENAFGILASRFRIFHTPINIKITSTIDKIVFSCCILHNLMNETPMRHEEIEAGRRQVNEWFIPLENIARGRINAGAKAIQDFLCDYVYYGYED